MVSDSSNRCIGCGRDVQWSLTGSQCVHCLLDLADSDSDLNQELADSLSGQEFLADGVLPRFG
ncbi:MAG: hypothetical protein ACTHOU_11280, partial [Aureliella sp.]